MVDMTGKVLVDHNNTARNIRHLLKIVHLHAHDIVLKGGIRRHLRKIGSRIIGIPSPEVARATRRVVVTITSHLLYCTLPAAALEEWSHCGKAGTDNGDGAFDDHPVEDGRQTI